jgi:hypothetical protein
MEHIQVHKEQFKHSNNHNLLAYAHKYYKDNVCLIAYSIYDLVDDEEWLKHKANSYVSYHLEPKECLESEIEINLPTYKQLLLDYYDTTTKA